MRNELTGWAAGVAKPLCLSGEEKGKNPWDSSGKNDSKKIIL